MEKKGRKREALVDPFQQQSTFRACGPSRLMVEALAAVAKNERWGVLNVRSPMQGTGVAFLKARSPIQKKKRKWKE